MELKFEETDYACGLKNGRHNLFIREFKYCFRHFKIRSTTVMKMTRETIMAEWLMAVQGKWPSGLQSRLTSSSFGRDVKLGVPCLDAACTVGL